MTFDNWIKTVLGTKIDFDGKYKNQCVDFIKAYEYYVLNIPPTACGDAWEYYAKYDNNVFLKKYFTKIKNTPDFVPLKGDIVVWNRNFGYYGHVAIATGEGNTSYFYSYDQNKGGNLEPIQRVWHDYKNVYGVLRPKDAKNITGGSQENKPFLVKVNCDVLNVRDGVGLGYKVVTRVRKNEVYTILETKVSNGYTWGRLKSGVGWIALNYTVRL